MKRPTPNNRTRRVPTRLAPSPTKEKLVQYERLAEYLGSGEHKSAPWEGVRPSSRKEKNANRCPMTISKLQATNMLKAGIRAGNISEDFDGDMPRRVWYKRDSLLFEARLTDRADIESGKPAGYKGWPANSEDLPMKPHEVRQCDEI